jgi:hypothetical protein
MFLSLYGPQLLANIYIYHLFVIISVTYFTLLNINYKFTKHSLMVLTVMSVLVLTFILNAIVASLADSFMLTIASIGGLEAYLEIFFGIFFGFILYKNGVSLITLEKFVLFVLMPIATITIIFYILSPDEARSIINNYLYGVSATAQWRFSGFYGLPYYAAIGYLVFLFEIIIALRKKLRKSIKLYLQLSFIIILIGGIVAASKTFILGVFILFIFAIFTSKKPLKILSLSIFLISLFLIAITQNIGDRFKGEIKLMKNYSFDSMYEAIEFRYWSDENLAASALFSDDNWNPYIGIGGNATNYPTDSQFRDVVYRFGYIGLIFFMIFLSSIFYYVSFEYKFLLIILAIGSLGSNGFTPIGSTLIIWTLINLNILENRKSYRQKLMI